MSQQRLMKSGNQRRALPAESNIAATKIADHRYPGTRDDLIVVANLQRVRRDSRRFMSHGLPMTANRNDLMRFQFFLCQQRIHSLGKQITELCVKLAKLR